VFSYPVLDILRELTVRIWVGSSISIGLVVSPVEEPSCGLLDMASITGYLTLSVFLRCYAAATINRQVKGLYWLFLLFFRLFLLLKWLLCVRVVRLLRMRVVRLLRMRLLHLLLLCMGLWRMWLWNMSAMSSKELLVAITKALALSVKALLLA
jgi:hypothetical protein